MANKLLEYILWIQGNGGGDPPVTDVTQTSFNVNTTNGRLMWIKPENYKGTTFSVSSADLIARAATGSDVEDMEMDADGYVLVETE